MPNRRQKDVNNFPTVIEFRIQCDLIYMFEQFLAGVIEDRRM